MKHTFETLTKITSETKNLTTTVVFTYLGVKYMLVEESSVLKANDSHITVPKTLVTTLYTYSNKSSNYFQIKSWQDKDIDMAKIECAELLISDKPLIWSNTRNHTEIFFTKTGKYYSITDCSYETLKEPKPYYYYACYCSHTKNFAIERNTPIDFSKEETLRTILGASES